jgi:polyisoprenoid-binding protein YceI
MRSTKYVLDGRASQFTVQAFAEGTAGIADHRPTFAVREFSGELEFDPANLNHASLLLTVKVRSLVVKDEVSEADRRAIERVMFGEVLHPEKHPEVLFRSTRVVCTRVDENRYRAEMDGVVALEGEENPEVLDVQIVLSEGSMRAYGELRLKQSNYGLKIASVAGGLLRIKDELKFLFFMVARQVEQASSKSAVAGSGRNL